MIPLRAAALLPLLLAALPATAEPPIRVYGPGGPGPPMKKIAQAFERSAGVKVELTAGPTEKWIARAREDADVVYSGAE